MGGVIMLAYVRSCARGAGAAAEKGASAVEYGLMVAAMAAVIVGTVFALGGFVRDSFDQACSALRRPLAGSCSTAGS
jgi:pilus assembly protein Flp/PilA